MPLGLADELFEIPRRNTRRGPPVLLWNHRCEYDKNPEGFFESLFDLERAGVNFRLVVLGEQFREAPPIFASAQKILKHRIEQYGYVAGRKEYQAWLERADVVVSTAWHEFFGLAVLEAVAAGCLPLLPRRLSYPELIPEEVHGDCLYDDEGDFKKKLRAILAEMHTRL